MLRTAILGDSFVKPITNIDDPRYVKAMSHPLRVRILALLDERSASPVELSGWLGATLGTTAYHVRTLERLGLIELVAESRVRGAVARTCSRVCRSAPTWVTARVFRKWRRSRLMFRVRTARWRSPTRMAP